MLARSQERTMPTSPPHKWDPQSPAARENLTAVCDEMRERCPVAYSDAFGWSLFRHEDVMQALEDPTSFSNVVSAHLSVPNGMDPPQHTDYRRIIEPYFSLDRMAALEPRCRAIARDAVASLPRPGEFDVMAGFADEFALQAQCAFLNWPVDLHRPLRDWVRKNHEATRSRDRAAMAAVAFEFDQHIRAVLDERRAAELEEADIAGELLREQIADRTLTNEEIVSILRNWTVGELATIAACIGILIAFLAEREELQTRLRENPSLLPRAIDEILRIESPLMTSRRMATRSLCIAGRDIQRGERVTLMWGSANRDERAFEDAAQFRLDRDQSLNLLYGAGIHVCPGAPLARLELRVLIDELLAAVVIAPSAARQPTRAMHPASGFSTCPVMLCALR
jgi:cytochrome P450